MYSWFASIGCQGNDKDLFISPRLYSIEYSSRNILCLEERTWIIECRRNRTNLEGEDEFMLSKTLHYIGLWISLMLLTNNDANKTFIGT